MEDPKLARGSHSAEASHRLRLQLYRILRAQLENFSVVVWTQNKASSAFGGFRSTGSNGRSHTGLNANNDNYDFAQGSRLEQG